MDLHREKLISSATRLYEAEDKLDFEKSNLLIEMKSVIEITLKQLGYSVIFNNSAMKCALTISMENKVVYIDFTQKEELKFLSDFLQKLNDGFKAENLINIDIDIENSKPNPKNYHYYLLFSIPTSFILDIFSNDKNIYVGLNVTLWFVFALSIYFRDSSLWRKKHNKELLKLKSAI
jgi:hypothetical protein